MHPPEIWLQKNRTPGLLGLIGAPVSIIRTLLLIGARDLMKKKPTFLCTLVFFNLNKIGYVNIIFSFLV